MQVTAPLAEALECTVLLENNVKAFAQAELTYGLGRTEENLLLLKWGPGVGSAIIAQGRIYESRMYKSAEIGHVRVEKNGRLCRCGRHGCLETRVASHPIARHLRQVCSPETTPLLWAAVGGRPENITVHNLDTLAALDEPAMWEALDADIEVLADVVGSCLTMFTPSNLVPCTGICSSCRTSGKNSSPPASGTTPPTTKIISVSQNWLKSWNTSGRWRL